MLRWRPFIHMCTQQPADLEPTVSQRRVYRFRVFRALGFPADSFPAAACRAATTGPCRSDARLQIHQNTGARCCRACAGQGRGSICRCAARCQDHGAAPWKWVLMCSITAGQPYKLTRCQLTMSSATSSWHRVPAAISTLSKNTGSLNSEDGSLYERWKSNAADLLYTQRMMVYMHRSQMR